MFSYRYRASLCAALLGLLSLPGTTQPIGKLETTTSRKVRPIRDLIDRWNAAYRNLDSKTLASLEAPGVQIVDRFGELRTPSTEGEKQRLWADGFEQIAKAGFRVEYAIERIRFVQPEAAVVQVCTQYTDGITLLDGARIPPLSEIMSYVVVESHGVWLVKELNIHDRAASEGCETVGQNGM
jgi:uncharacterized protein (TIGR02246 family)